MNALRALIKTHIKLLLRRGVCLSYSQFGEDAVIQHILRNKTGTYVDVGAYHPVLYSNTYALYKRGWKGVVIDPNPSARTLFRWFRRRDTFINAAVGISGEQTYYQYDDAAYNSLGNPAPQRKGLQLIHTNQVTIRPLSELLKHVGHIDFMSVDVEGMDLEVLQTHDWSNKPRVIAVEGSMQDPTHVFLESKSYSLVGVAGLTMIFELRS
ncbi:MAG: SAM-dependent methyltransferase [Candidatus Adlerbacteria bacterium]|nr:SAM-dependent methyltransferase [Candidatus Adlerbacteria bacterium]